MTMTMIQKSYNTTWGVQQKEERRCHWAVKVRQNQTVRQVQILGDSLADIICSGPEIID